MADVTVTEVVEVVTVSESVVAVTVTDSGSPGTPGPAIELQASPTHIQYRIVGEPTWIDLVALSSLEGPAGSAGAAGADGDDGVDGTDGVGITAGVVEIDFGSTPTNEASVTVTGQTGIQTTSTVDATVMARSTSNNTITDHQFAANALRFSVSEPVADTGFTITAYCLIGSVTGKFNVNWRWS